MFTTANYKDEGLDHKVVKFHKYGEPSMNIIKISSYISLFPGLIPMQPKLTVNKETIYISQTATIPSVLLVNLGGIKTP